MASGRELAEALGVSTATVFRWFKLGAPREPGAMRSWAIARGIFGRKPGRPVGSKDKNPRPRRPKKPKVYKRSWDPIPGGFKMAAHIARELGRKIYSQAWIRRGAPLFKINGVWYGDPVAVKAWLESVREANRDATRKRFGYTQAETRKDLERQEAVKDRARSRARASWEKARSDPEKMAELRAKRNAWSAANRDRENERHAAYRERNREKLLEKEGARYWKRAEYRANKCAKEQGRKREKVAAVHRAHDEYRANNPAVGQLVSSILGGADD